MVSTMPMVCCFYGFDIEQAIDFLSKSVTDSTEAAVTSEVAMLVVHGRPQLILEHGLHILGAPQIACAQQLDY